MKTLLIITTAILGAVTTSSPAKRTSLPVSKPISCFQDTVPKNKQGNMAQGQYKDIRTGQPLSLNYDRQRRMMMNTATGKPVDFYLNSTGDTVSGYGYIVNNYLLMQPDSSYRLDMSRIRSTNNRYYVIDGNKELSMDKNWPGNRQRNQSSGRDSL